MMHNLEIVEELARTQGCSSLSRALDTVQQTGAKVLIVESLADLSDAVAVQEIFIEAARRCGATVVHIRPLGARDEGRESVRAALEMLSQREQKILGARLNAARIGARLAGGHREGRKPYGFSKNPDEALYERKTLLKMQDLRSRGVSFRRIANSLNSEGIRPRKGQLWWGKTVSLILRNAGKLQD